MGQVTLDDIVTDVEGFSIFYGIGQIIAIVSSFVLYHAGDIHYIFSGFAVLALSMVTAAVPGIRIILWPVAMGGVILGLTTNPTIISDFMLGNGPSSIMGIGIGWIYVLLFVLAAHAIPRIGVYTNSSGPIFLIGFGSLLYNILNKE